MLIIGSNFTLKSFKINALHPVSRLISTIIYIVFVAMFCKIITLIVAFIFSVLMVLVFNLNIKTIFKGIKPILWFLMLIWIFFPLFEKTNILTDNELVISGSWLALQITLKAFAVSLAFITFVASMSLDTLGYSLKKIYISDKIIHLFLISYKYIFLIGKEYKKLLFAIKVRNFKPRTNIHTYKTYSYLVAILFIRAYERAKRINNAMLCRNFKGSFIIIKEYEFNYQSIFFVFFMGLIVIILFFFELGGMFFFII